MEQGYTLVLFSLLKELSDDFISVESTVGNDTSTVVAPTPIQVQVCTLVAGHRVRGLM
jgi:hypothetical protein